MSNNSKSCLKHDIAKIEEWDIGQVKRGKKEGVIKKTAPNLCYGCGEVHFKTVYNPLPNKKSVFNMENCVIKSLQIKEEKKIF